MTTPSTPGQNGAAALATPRGTPSRRGKSPRSARSHTPNHMASNTMPTEDAAAKPAATFTSCLAIPVQGAIPIESPPSPTEPPPPRPEPEAKRAPRKSKIEALAAMQNHSSSSTGESSSSFVTEAGTRVYRFDGPPIPTDTVLNMSSLKTTSLRDPPPRTKPRLFGLEECPVYFPTAEEFKDPMAYVRSISEAAKPYGMCKIVPPTNWHMPFVTDTENFRFKTRLMRLNQIEASSRAKVNFLEQLYRFHKQQGNPRVAVPTINHKPLDLWLLRKEVNRLGGYEEVTRTKKWADLGRRLGYTGIPGLSTQIKNSYTRVILPYEHFCERVRNSPSLSPSANRTGDAQSRPPMALESASKMSRLSASATPAEDTSPPSSPLTATSSPLSEPPDDGEYRANGDRPRRTRRTSSYDANAPPRNLDPSPLLPSPTITSSATFRDKEAAAPPSSETSCEVCHKKNRGEEMLLCDGCDCGFHMFCLDPPLTTVPKGQWFCHTCLFGTGGDFGFDEGEEHSLSSFQKRDLEFRRMWFKSHPPPQEDKVDGDPTLVQMDEVKVSEDDVEEEFWRLVQSQHDTVEVEYGADVHSTTHGSAMPTLETHPLNVYSKDPWNLNNIPILSESLLRYIKSDISGMTVPWTYVGMTFSAFCWHNEDHYTYSVNYMHWGDTKTWYGVPGEDADKFEAAARKEAPELFEAQPDLLFQLVTLMNPKRLAESGVRVYACNQRAGEFVITFPKAYHCGFNQGLNFNEAVNFALPDWLPEGLACVQRYREHRKQPVFSHDELVITITQQSETIETAIWLIDSLKEMVRRELNARDRVRNHGLPELLEEEDRPEEQYQCVVCKMFCYLSQITCPCTTKVACLDHAEVLCGCVITRRTLRKRFSDEYLIDTQRKVEDRVSIPETWRAKLHRVLAETASPQLKVLRGLLQEGDHINYHLPELRALRKCVARANKWVEAANNFLSRKNQKRPTRRTKGTRHNMGNEMDDDRSDGSLAELQDLLVQVDTLGFDCPEIGRLKAMADEAEDMKTKALNLLRSREQEPDRDAYVRHCEQLLISGSSLNVHLSEIDELKRSVAREKLIKELEEKIDDPQTTLEEVRQLSKRAREIGLPSDLELGQVLEMRRRAGDDWERRARETMSKSCKDIEALEDCYNVDSTTPVDPTLHDRILAARTKAKDYEKQARSYLLPSPSQKPRASEAMKLVTRVEKDFIIPSVQDLKRTAEFANDLEQRCDNVLKNRFNHTDEGDVFEAMQQWKRYAREHLTMFSLPNFEKLEGQLKAHGQWLESLPWYCSQHKEAHGKQVLEDVMESTRPEDDLPPSDEYFTCICTTAVRPPPPGGHSDAVQCDHCYARFHGVCAANGGSCPFCDHHHWNGAIHKERSWHFCYLPNLLLSAPEITKNYSDDWKQLEMMVHRVDRLSMVIGQFLAFASQPGNQRPEYIPQVRHYMRKLYKIQFAVSPNPEVSFGLDLAGLHRILAGQPVPIRMKKRRRPRFTFGQDVDKDWTDNTRCICRGRTPYLLNYPKVECELCNKWYHAGCVFFPIDPATSVKNRFMCPLCCLRKNRNYPYAEVRVKHIENNEPDTYVDTREMLDSFSKDIIYMKLPPPYTNTLFVELIRFTPGQPENIAVNGPPPRSMPPPVPRMPYTNGMAAHSRLTPPNSVASVPPPVQAAPPPYNPSERPAPANPHHHIPPTPPWSSRYHGPSAPIAPSGICPPGSLPVPVTPNQQSSTTPRTPELLRKRKYGEDEPSSANGMGSPSITLPPVASLQTRAPPIDRHMTPSSPPRKRRHDGDQSGFGADGFPPDNLSSQQSAKRLPAPVRTPMTPSAQTVPTPRPQTLSPSLANILSPSPSDIRGGSARHGSSTNGFGLGPSSKPQENGTPDRLPVKRLKLVLRDPHETSSTANPSAS